MRSVGTVLMGPIVAGDVIVRAYITDYMVGNPFPFQCNFMGVDIRTGDIVSRLTPMHTSTPCVRRNMRAVVYVQALPVTLTILEPLPVPPIPYVALTH